MVRLHFFTLLALLSLTGCMGATTTDCPLSAQWWYHERYSVPALDMANDIRPNPSTVTSLASSRGR